MEKKSKIIVTLNESGTVEVYALDPEAVDIIVLEYGISEEPEIYVNLGPCIVNPNAQDFNNIIDCAIGKLEEAIERCEDDEDISMDEIADWAEEIEGLEKFKV